MRRYTWRGDYLMDGCSYKNYKIVLSYSKVTTTSIYPYLGHLKSTFSSSPVFHSNFIYLPTRFLHSAKSLWFAFCTLRDASNLKSRAWAGSLFCEKLLPAGSQICRVLDLNLPIVNMTLQILLHVTKRRPRGKWGLFSLLVWARREWNHGIKVSTFNWLVLV